jgi:arylsulfatase A-like enzyme
MDSVVSQKEKHSGIYDLERARRRYWRPGAEERRRALMPFFWNTLAPQGIVLGNKDRGSHVTLRNPHWFSYPGYSEILTGQFQPDVTSNDPIRYPHRTVLEHVRERLRLPFTGVASIGSWDTFEEISSSCEGAFFVNAGERAVPEKYATPRMKYLASLQDQALTLWEGSRLDAFSVEMALEYLRRHRPRLLYVGLGDTDEWAHARRYDRLLDQIHVFDESLRRLWEALESSEAYRGRTTLIVTTDHGRPATPKDWPEHGEGLEGSEDIWIAVIGPDTPDLGELAPYPTVHQADIAATLLGFFGLDPKEFNPEAGPPIPAAYGRPHPAEASPVAGGAAAGGAGAAGTAGD